MNLLTLKKYDSQQMYKIYDKWPEIARSSFESKQESVNFDNVKHVVFAGMGGSGTVGDVFASILSKSKIHVNVVKGYILPQTVNSDTLVITVSVSGDTSETLAILKSAHNIKCRIIAFSSGGKMEQYCKKNKIKHVLIPIQHSPRTSLTAYLYNMLKVLYVTLGIKQNDILESLVELEKLSKKISSSNLTSNNPALSLAKSINGIPIIYYPFGLQSAAIRFKNSLQENAKIHVIIEDVVETCHNGIVAWEKKSEIQPILILGKDDYIMTKKRWKVIKKYFKNKKIKYVEISSIKGNILSKLINLIYLLDYCSIYKAVLLKTDPSPVKSIDFIKNQMNQFNTDNKKYGNKN